MDIKITGQHIKIGDALRQHVIKALENTAQNLFANPIDGSVIFTKQRYDFFVEITLHPMKGIKLQGHAHADDPYVAFDIAISKIARQSRRYHSKIKDHKHQSTAEAIQALYAQHYVLHTNHDKDDHANDAHHHDEDKQPAIIAEMQGEIDSMTVSEAVMHMDLRDQQTLVFKNKGHGRLNIIYRRPDGNIGWVDPQLVEKIQEN